MTDHTLLPKIPTSLGSWVLLVAKAIESYGLDSREIFKNSGLELEEIKQPHSRIPTSVMGKVWQQAKEQTQDPYIALKVASYFQPGVFSALGMALAASHHVYDALKRASRYSQMVSDGSITEIIEDETRVCFAVKPRPPLSISVNTLGVEALLASLVTSLRLIAGDNFAPKAVQFQHAFDGDTKPYQQYFGCEVTFSNPINQIIFERDAIFDEHLFANSVLTCTLDNWIADHLSNFKEDLVATQVQKYILKNLAYGEMDQQKVATELAMSSRKLQRALKDEGTNYSELLDDCRHQMAIQLIGQNKLALSEVTFILGFSDQSNFSRAFKRWTGCTPHQYKK